MRRFVVGNGTLDLYGFAPSKHIAVVHRNTAVAVALLTCDIAELVRNCPSELVIPGAKLNRKVVAPLAVAVDSLDQSALCWCHRSYHIEHQLKFGGIRIPAMDADSMPLNSVERGRRDLVVVSSTPLRLGVDYLVFVNRDRRSGRPSRL